VDVDSHQHAGTLPSALRQALETAA
jgi:hypothetical protein